MSRPLATVSVRHDVRRAVVEIQKLREDVSDKATYRALNRALDKVATETGREIRKVYNVKHRAVLNAIKKQRARAGRLYAVMEMRGTRIPLIEFSATWKRGQKTGASVKVLVRGARKRIQGAWIGVHGHTGALQVFQRVGKERYPIKSLRSVSVPQAFSNEAVIAAVNAIAAESFGKNYEQQLRFLTRGR